MSATQLASRPSTLLPLLAGPPGDVGDTEDRVEAERIVARSLRPSANRSMPRASSRRRIGIGTSMSPPARSVLGELPVSSHTWQLLSVAAHRCRRSSGERSPGPRHGRPASPVVDDLHRPDALDRHWRHRQQQRRRVGAAARPPKRWRTSWVKPRAIDKPDQAAVVRGDRAAHVVRMGLEQHGGGA